MRKTAGHLSVLEKKRKWSYWGGFSFCFSFFSIGKLKLESKYSESWNPGSLAHFLISHIHCSLIVIFSLSWRSFSEAVWLSGKSVGFEIRYLHSLLCLYFYQKLSYLCVLLSPGTRLRARPSLHSMPHPERCTVLAQSAGSANMCWVTSYWDSVMWRVVTYLFNKHMLGSRDAAVPGEPGSSPEKGTTWATDKSSESGLTQTCSAKLTGHVILAKWLNLSEALFLI